MRSISIDYALKAQSSLSGLSVFALVDGLQYERFFSEELVIEENLSLPLFNKFPESRIAFAGPWLIQDNSVANIREKLCELEVALPSVSWIVSSSSLNELAAHFRKIMNIVLPDGRVALLRFQDPRVQFRLGTILNSQQHWELTHLTNEWLTIVDGKVWSLKQREFIC